MTTTLDDINFWFTKNDRPFAGCGDLYAGEWFTEDFPEYWASAKAAHEWMTAYNKGTDTKGINIAWAVWDDTTRRYIGHIKSTAHA